MGYRAKKGKKSQKKGWFKGGVKFDKGEVKASLSVMNLLVTSCFLEDVTAGHRNKDLAMVTELINK